MGNLNEKKIKKSIKEYQEQLKEKEEKKIIEKEVILIIKKR